MRVSLIAAGCTLIGVGTASFGVFFGTLILVVIVVVEIDTINERLRK